MATTKVLRIVDSLGQEVDSRDIGAEAQNIEVSRDEEGKIITNVTPEDEVASVEGLAVTLRNIEDNAQSLLNFDDEPTEGSSNPVKSGGIYTAIQADTTLNAASTRPVQNRIVTNALNDKVGTYAATPSAWDTEPTENSTKPVTSGGIYAAIQAGGGGGGSSTNFVGTLAQWNALSAADKAKYNTYDLTDDYEGRGVDSELSPTSTNPVQNKVIYQALQNAGGLEYTTDGTTDSYATVQNAVKDVTISGTTLPKNVASGLFSHAEGIGTKASGGNSHAEGYSTSAGGSISHAEGESTSANGNSSHAEGGYTKTTGTTSHAEGYYTSAIGNGSHAEGDHTIASGNYSHVEGQQTIAIHGRSHAEGYQTTADGQTSHAEGFQTSAGGEESHTEGYNTIAYGDGSHAEGWQTSAVGEISHAEGHQTVVSGRDSHAEGNQTSASGHYGSHAEGEGTIASGDSSHAEGQSTLASGEGSHAEGYNTTASGFISHAEGSATSASGENSHSEGLQTASISTATHAEGYQTTASDIACHAEGYKTLASGTLSHAEGANTIASGQGSHAEGDWTIASGNDSHAEGYFTTASGYYSHAEGNQTMASDIYSHAEGASTIASGSNSHAEGFQTTASGSNSHAEGESTIVNKSWSHAEGYSTTASGQCSHAEGSRTSASGQNSHTEGGNTKASGQSSHAEGSGTLASGKYSHAEGEASEAVGEGSHAAGFSTIANTYQTVVGSMNVSQGSSTSYTSNSGYFIVGAGGGTRANCFRATESNTYGKTYSPSGADYAEMFEWLDGNQNNEDRAGKFVTVDGDKIKLATSNDDYILGIISGNPSVMGNTYDDQWQGTFETDVFGRPIYEKQERELDDGTKVYDDILKVSENYDNTQSYIGRSERPEWDAVGLLGKLVCIDDGTGEVNGYVTVNDDSIATKANERTKYRVMKRIDESHIQIMIL